MDLCPSPRPTRSDTSELPPEDAATVLLEVGSTSPTGGIEGEDMRAVLRYAMGDDNPLRRIAYESGSVEARTLRLLALAMCDTFETSLPLGVGRMPPPPPSASWMGVSPSRAAHGSVMDTFDTNPPFRTS